MYRTCRPVMILVGFSAAVCMAVLVNIRIYSAQITENFSGEPTVYPAERGRIFDRRGVLLADNYGGGRIYPLAVCPHTLGTLSSDGRAQSGIELAFDEVLSGTDGHSDRFEDVPPIDGRDIYLTIDSRIQTAAENILRTAGERYRKGVDYASEAPYSASAGAIVMLDCKRGEVLAKASYPDYKLADYNKEYDRLAADSSLPLPDRASQGLYRPGSTLKTVTAAAALSCGAIKKDTRFWCGSTFRVGDTLFSCMNAHGSVDVRKAIDISCNIFFYRTALILGIDRLCGYEKRFGLGVQPEFELPTLPGQIASPENTANWGSGQLVQAAIGQSTTECTPLQMACQALTLANRGRRYSPTLIRSIGSQNSAQAAKPVEPAEIIPDNGAFEIVKEGMVSSTAYTYGEYALSQLDKPAAIKTGTPQSPRGYDSAVIGFYPADDPEIAFAVMLEGGANAKHTVYELIKAYEEAMDS